MATIDVEDIYKGTITQKIKDIGKAELFLKPGVDVGDGDLVNIEGPYTGNGYQDEWWLLQGYIEDVDFLNKQKINVISNSEEIYNSPTATYYGRMGGLIQDLLDIECSLVNHSFSSSSPYIFRAPHNFRNIVDGGEPTSYWSVSEPASSSVEVVASVGDHKKPLKIYQNNSGASAGVTNIIGTPSKTGNIEFYLRMEQTNKRFIILFGDENFNYGIRIYVEDDGSFEYCDSLGAFQEIQNYSANTWYHFRIQWDIDADEWSCWIDDVLKVNAVAMYSVSDIPDGPERFYILGSWVLGATLYFDAFGATYDNNYEIGLNKEKEYDQLDYSSEWQKWVLKGDKTIKTLLNIYTDSFLKIWYIDPDDEIFINDGDKDSGVEIYPTDKVWDIKGNRLVKNIDMVILKGGYSGSARLYSVAGGGSVIYRDTYANITDQDTLDDIADNLLINTSENPITLQMYLKDDVAGLIQPGETVYIRSGIKFSNSTREIPEGDYIISQTKYYIKDSKYEKVDLTLNSGLVFERNIEEDLPQENSDLISQVGIAASEGEANTGSNVGTDGYGVFDGKIGATLGFRNIAPGSSKITTTLNGNDIDIDVAQGNIDHDSLLNFDSDEHYKWADSIAQNIHKDNITQESITQHEGALSITESQISDLDHTDENAFHYGASGEIYDLSYKGTLSNNDVLLIEDSENGWIKKKTTISDLGLAGSGDSYAIHDNVQSEIYLISPKTTPISADILIIEDSENSYNKKKLTLDDLTAFLDNSYYTETEIAQMLQLTSSNKSYINLPAFGAAYKSDNWRLTAIGTMYNYGAGATVRMGFTCPLPLQLADGKHLHADYMYIGLYDADGNDYIKAIHIEGWQTYSVYTTLYSNTTARTSPGEIGLSIGTNDFGDYKGIVITIEINSTTSAELEIGYIRARYWYE